MSTKAKALAVAARFGFMLDETNSGSDPGGGYAAIMDHPTHHIAGDHRSIVVSSYPPNAATFVWRSIIERMNSEGPLLELCDDPECEYHSELE